MKTPRYTIDTLHQQFPDDDACLDYMFQKQHGELKACPKCGVVSPKFYRVRNRKCYECNDCGYQLSPLANTMFHKSDTPLKKWFYAIYLFGVGKNGVSAKEIERHLGVTYKTAWRMAKQIRLMMQQDGNPLSGIVEADETYVGGVRRKSVQNSQWENKTAVVGIVEKKKGQGKVKAFATKHADATVTLPFLRSNILPGSTLHTDDSRIYSRVKRDFTHEFVNHSKLEYVKSGVHTNTIEGFWGQLKRSLDGTYHCVSPKYLQYYVNEFVYRYNHRDVAAFPALMEVAVKHVQ
ncbi:MAG TPA: IS1595 family transposase [Candidatus Saccharimonadales bacterium]|nr:IS1595 family transposase [Candidatus Saccharimonadales bacterium]